MQTIELAFIDDVLGIETKLEEFEQRENQKRAALDEAALAATKDPPDADGVVAALADAFPGVFAKASPNPSDKTFVAAGQALAKELRAQADAGQLAADLQAALEEEHRAGRARGLQADGPAGPPVPFPQTPNPLPRFSDPGKERSTAGAHERPGGSDRKTQAR